MLENGRIANMWTEAPEDTGADIEDARRTATNYMTFDVDEGLVIGDFREDTDTLQGNVRIDKDSVDIRSGSNTIATFSFDGVLGAASGTTQISAWSPNLILSTDNKEQMDFDFGGTPYIQLTDYPNSSSARVDAGLENITQGYIEVTHRHDDDETEIVAEANDIYLNGDVHIGDNVLNGLNMWKRHNFLNKM